MALVYIHKKLSDNTIFYVGIGQTKKRAYSTRNRNRWWKFTVQKHGFYVEIVKDDISKEESCELEKSLISLYGRRDLNKGTLVNLTDGGEGSIGFIPSEETKKKTSNSMKSKNIKRTKEEIEKMKATKVLKGTYMKISKKIKRTEILSNKVEEFNSLTLASSSSKIPRSSIHLTLHNKTNKNGDKVFAGGYNWEYI